MQGVEAERGVVREVLRSYPLGDTWMVEVEGWEPLGCGWFKAAKAKSRRAPHAGH